MARKKNPELIEAVARRIRERRLQCGLSQEALAERCGLQVESISRAENGRLQPTLVTLAALADGLEYGLADLVDPVPRGLEAEDEVLLARFHALTPEARTSLLVVLNALVVEPRRR